MVTAGDGWGKMEGMETDPAIVKFELPVNKQMETCLYHKVKTRRTLKSCEHRNIEVDLKARVVVCGSCGVSLDPIQCLYNLACWEERTDERVEQIRKHAQQEREKADRAQQKKAEQAQKRLSSFCENDEVWIEYGASEGRFGGGTRAIFKRIADGKVYVIPFGDDQERELCEVAKVTGASLKRRMPKSNWKPLGARAV
jgi:hypothetical protein